jgi:hypothetical protein
MAGILPNEGENLIANLLFKGSDVNRGTSLNLVLFTNTDNPIPETMTAAALTQPTGTDYGAISLANASWTVTADTAAYAARTFTAGAGGWAGSIYGYAILTTGTAPIIIAIERDAAGPYTMAVGDTYVITPNITLA